MEKCSEATVVWVGGFGERVGLWIYIKRSKEASAKVDLWAYCVLHWIAHWWLGLKQWLSENTATKIMKIMLRSSLLQSIISDFQIVKLNKMVFVVFKCGTFNYKGLFWIKPDSPS